MFCGLQHVQHVACLQVAGVVSFPPLSMPKARSLLPVTVLYVSNVGFALLGLQSLNIPMYNTLKRLTPMLVLGAKVLVHISFGHEGNTNNNIFKPLTPMLVLLAKTLVHVST